MISSTARLGVKRGIKRRCGSMSDTIFSASMAIERLLCRPSDAKVLFGSKDEMIEPANDLGNTAFRLCVATKCSDMRSVKDASRPRS